MRLDSPAKNAQPGCDLQTHTQQPHHLSGISLSHLHTLIAWWCNMYSQSRGTVISERSAQVIWHLFVPTSPPLHGRRALWAVPLPFGCLGQTHTTVVEPLDRTLWEKTGKSRDQMTISLSAIKMSLQWPRILQHVFFICINYIQFSIL